MKIVQTIYDDSKKGRVIIFQRKDGTFGFDSEHFSDEPREMTWLPAGFDSSCDTAERALSEARDRVDWLAKKTNISVHDNILLAYEVLAEKREIRLRTRHTRDKSIEHTDIIFHGVEGYYFYNDNFETIIFDVTPVSVESILTDDKARFEEGWRFGWPGRWSNTEATRRAYLAEHDIRGFSLSSSYGMCGWILAKSMELILKNDALSDNSPPL